MPVVKYAVSNLSQGASQQAESQRFPSQAAEQINAYSSHVKGLTKRPPTEHIAEIGVNATSSTKSFLHLLNRDSSEQYAVVVNQGVEVDITGVINAGTENNALTYESTENKFSVNDKIQLLKFSYGDEIPTGLEQGISYFVHSMGAVDGSTRWLKVKATKNATANITVGTTELVAPALGTSTDEYKAGMLIESLKLDDGTWIDGVITLRFDATKGHNFDVGELVEMPSENWQGTSSYFYWGQVNKLELFQPTKTQSLTSSGTAGQTLRANELANKFWLKHKGSWPHAKALQHGFFVDGDHLHFDETWGERFAKGESQVNEVVGWAFLDNSQFSIAGNKLTRQTGTFDCTTLAAGRLLKIGGAATNPRAIVVSTTATEITCAEALDTTGIIYDDTSNNRCQLRGWATIVNSNAARQFLETDYRTSNKIVQFGDPGGTCKAIGGVTGAGPFVYDLNTGVECPVEASDNIANPYRYLLDITNPSADLKAKTIGDTTFLINKTVHVRESNWSPHHERFEAFVTVRQADYNKNYRIKIGSDAVEAVQAEERGAAATKGYALLYGNATATSTAVARPICRIQHKKAGFGNSLKIRLLQNFRFAYGYQATDGASAVFANWGTQHYDLLPNDEGGKWLESSKQDLRRELKGIKLDAYMKTEGGFHKDENKDSKFVAIHYDKTYRKLFIWINFYWAKGVPGELSNRTTVGHLKEHLAGSAAGGEWEVVLCDDQGRIAGDDNYDSSSLSAESNFFLETELGKVTHPEKQNWGNKKNRDTYEYGRWEMPWGMDYIVRETGYYKQLTDSVFDPLRQYMKIGLMSPSTPDSTTEDRLKKRGRAITAGASGTGVTTGLGTGSSTDLYDGEYFYRSPKWIGDEDQTAVGTERIAEMLSSNMRIAEGVWLVSNDGAGGNQANLQRADGRKLSSYEGDADKRLKQKEAGLGLTYRAADLEASAVTGATKILQKLSAPTERVLDDVQDWIVEQKGSTIAIRRSDDDLPFPISVSDDLGDAGLDLTYYEVAEQAKLPDICRHGHVVRVVGNAREAADDYYLKFVADNEDAEELSRGRWIECQGFDTTVSINPRSMPVTLTRKFKPDGTKYFELAHRAWDERGAGDNYTNPMPSFVGRRLTDIFLFKNRFGFLSDRNVILSESGEYFNFFRTTVAAFLDTSPIDVSAATERVTKLHTAHTFADRLVLFSDNQQFALQGDSYLSPKTVNITPTTAFASGTTCPPILSGTSVFFAFPRTDFSGVSEYFLSKDQVDSLDAKDITSHIPKYIKGNVIDMAVCPSEDVLAVLTDDNPTAVTDKAKLFIYKYYTADNQQKVQSAWFTYETGDKDAQILSIEFIQNKLYMVVLRGSIVCLEFILFEDSQKDTSRNFKILLDRRVKMASGVGEVTVNGSDTNIAVPYAPSTSFTVVLANNTQLTASSVTSTHAVFAGVDLRGQELIMGEPYTMEYTLSKPYLRKAQSEGKGPLYGGRHQLFRGALEFSNARSFDVAVTHLPQNVTQSSTHTFNGTELGYATAIEGASTLSQGVYKFGIMGKSDRVNIKISNDTPYPSDFLSIDYEGRAYSRATRWG